MYFTYPDNEDTDTHTNKPFYDTILLKESVLEENWWIAERVISKLVNLKSTFIEFFSDKISIVKIILQN